MIKVTVTSDKVRAMSGIGKVSQKPYNLAFQTVYLHTVDADGIISPFPEKVEVILDKSDKGVPLHYAPGEYTLHPSSVQIGRDGNPALNLRLMPIKQRATA